MPCDPKKTALAVLVACVALAGLSFIALASTAATPAASAANFQFGLADYEPATFSDPRVAELGVHLARDVVPWNVVAVPRDLAAVTAWLAAVKQAGITPLITFQHADSSGRAPRKAQFLKDFLRFRALFGWVTEFCPWDEATHAGQPTARHPKLAAQYYNAIASHCSGCVVTAPDTLDADGNIERWIGKFLAERPPVSQDLAAKSLPQRQHQGLKPDQTAPLLHPWPSLVQRGRRHRLVALSQPADLPRRGLRGAAPPRTSSSSLRSAPGSRASTTTTGARPGLLRARRSPPGTPASSAPTGSRGQLYLPSRKPSTGSSRRRRRRVSSRQVSSRRGRAAQPTTSGCSSRQAPPDPGRRALYCSSTAPTSTNGMKFTACSTSAYGSAEE